MSEEINEKKVEETKSQEEENKSYSPTTTKQDTISDIHIHFYGMDDDEPDIYDPCKGEALKFSEDEDVVIFIVPKSKHTSYMKTDDFRRGKREGCLVNLTSKELRQVHHELEVLLCEKEGYEPQNKKQCLKKE